MDALLEETIKNRFLYSKFVADWHMKMLSNNEQFCYGVENNNI